MQPGVRYEIKHSGEFLYKLSNEEDKMNFKVILEIKLYSLLQITKIRLPGEI